LKAGRTRAAAYAAIWPELWENTRGQPWLVNALGNECTMEDRSARDRTVPITLERYKAARERLIQSRATHLDQLTDKLREPRVRQVMSDILSAENVEGRYPTDDLQYVEDLGLIRTRPQLEISNRIYREVIPRELTWTTQTVITHDQAWYLTPGRRLDMPKLLAAFQQFFRERSDAWEDGFDYREAGPHLLMQVFLQRIVLELKLVKKAPEAQERQGLAQTAGYARQVGADEAHLVLFDRRAEVPWDARIWQREAVQDGVTVSVWGA